MPGLFKNEIKITKYSEKLLKIQIPLFPRKSKVPNSNKMYAILNELYCKDVSYSSKTLKKEKE